MSASEHLHDNGAASISEKISALMRQVETRRAENERLISENESLKEINALLRQAEMLRSDNKRLAAANESLRVESTAHSAEEASTPGTAAWEGSNYLAQELNRVRDVALELGLGLQEPMKHDELSVLCSVICNESKLANLKGVLQKYSVPPHKHGYLLCLQQSVVDCTYPHLCLNRRNRICCASHEYSKKDCVWVYNSGSGWIIGSGQLQL